MRVMTTIKELLAKRASEGTLPNGCATSTTCSGHAARITGAPAGPKAQRAGRRSFMGLRRRNWGEALTLTIRYVGRSEPWVEIKTRGVTKRYAGDVCILHIVSDVNSRLPYPER